MMKALSVFVFLFVVVVSSQEASVSVKTAAVQSETTTATTATAATSAEEKSKNATANLVSDGQLRIDESEKWTDMALEAKPVLPAYPRGGILRDASTLVLNIDVAQRLLGKAAGPWPKFSSIPKMCSPEYSISFWLTVNDETGSDWRTIFYKGDTKGERAPALFLHPVTKRLQLHQSLGSGKNSDILVLSSTDSIPLYTPTHVAIVRRDKTTEIYIDGSLSGSSTHPGVNTCNEGSLHINPEIFGLKSFTGHIRNFKWYSIAVTSFDVKRMNFEGFDNSLVNLNFRKRYSGSVQDGDVIPHDDSFNSPDWTVAFWIKEMGGPIGLPRTLFQKGSSSDELAPALILLPSSNKISLRVNTEKYRSEGLLSPFEIRKNQLTHVAAVKAGNALRLYIAGTLAKEIRLSSAAKFNNGPLYIARSSSSSQHNGFDGEVISFRWYDRAFFASELRELAHATSPAPLASFRSDRSTSVSAIEFPNSSKFNVREFSVEFWLRLLTSKVSSTADKTRTHTAQDANDQEADSQDDDRARTEEQLLGDEFAEKSVSPIDPELDSLLKASAREEDLNTRVESIDTRLAAGAADAAKAAKGKSRDPFDSTNLGRFKAYDNDHLSNFDNDIARGNIDSGYEGFGDDEIQREPGGRWADSANEKEETEEMVHEIERQRQKIVNDAEANSDVSAENGEDDDSASDTPVVGGNEGIVGSEAKRASVIRNNEDRYTGYGDVSEDSGRRRENMRREPIDVARAHVVADEDGTHRGDDDMSVAQRPDEEGNHDGDVIDDNEVTADNGPDYGDNDVDPFLYGGSRRSGAEPNPVRKVTANSKPLEVDAQVDAVRAAANQHYQAAMNLANTALLQNGVKIVNENQVEEDAPLSNDGSEIVNTNGKRSSRSMLAVSEPESESEQQAAEHDQPAAKTEAASTSGSATETAAKPRALTDPANPLTEEMTDKEAATPVVEAPTAQADSDDKGKDAKGDFATSSDGEESMDENGNDANAAEGDPTASYDGSVPVAPAQHAEPADSSYAAESITGTTDVPGRDEADAVSTNGPSDESIIAEDDDQTPGATARKEEEQEQEEDLPSGGDDEEPPSSDTNEGSKYDEKFNEQLVPETPGHRPSEGIFKKPQATPSKLDIVQTAEDNSEGDYATGEIPANLALFRKGSSWSEFTPTLQLIPETLQLRARVSTAKATNETLVSKGSIYTKQPNHIAMTVDGRVMRIFINGVLDSEKYLSSSVKFNDGPLRVARDLRTAGVGAQLSDFKFHGRALRPDELRQVKYSVSLPLRAYYNERVGDHLYSTRPLMKGVSGYRYLGVKGWIQSEPVPGSVPLYRFYNPALGDHRYSIDSLDDSETGYAYSGIVGYVYTQYRKNTAALIEFYNPAVGDHFYTVDPNEVADSFYAGYNKVGTIAYVEVSRGSAVPVYRLYDRQLKPQASIEANARIDLDAKKNIKVLSTEMTNSDKAFSLAAWVEIFDDATGEIRMFFRKGDTNDVQTPSAYFQPATRQIEFAVTTATGVERWFSKNELPLNALTHVALVYDGTTIKFFVNGVVDSEYKPSGKIVQNTQPLVFGATSTKNAGNGFRGRVRDVRWYDHAMSTASFDRVLSVTTERPALTFSYSPKFVVTTAVTIPHQKALISREWSIFFTLEATGDCEDNLCNIVRTGEDASHAQVAIGLNSGGQIEVSMGTTAGALTVKSKEALSIRVPVSVGIVYEAGNLYLYQDGALENSASLAENAKPIYSQDDVAVGAIGNTKSFRGYLSAFEWHRSAFSPAEIVVIADRAVSPSLLTFERKDRYDLKTSIKFAAPREFNTIGASVTFWLKVLHHTDFMTAIVAKGASVAKANPAVLLRKDGRIQVVVQSQGHLQSAISHSVIPANIPTHVAVSRAGRTIKIFINGVEDTAHISGYPLVLNDEPITIGAFSDIPAPIGWIRGLEWHDTAFERPQVDRLMRQTM